MNLTPTAIREYDQQAPDRDETETATFALGCFWGPDARFGALDGVVRTRVGYAGGTKPDPTYRSLGDHTEAVQVDYVPEERSFRELLDVVFRNHDPNRQTGKTQYQNIVFVSTPEQRETLDEYLEANGLDAEAIETRIERLSAFYPAESYHQKHSLGQSVLDTFERAGYDSEDVRESPAAAKLNGRAAGHDVSLGAGIATAGDPTASNR